VRNPADWAEKYLDCVNVGVPACEKPLIDWALARKITRLSSYDFLSFRPKGEILPSVRNNKATAWQ
jgi:hypothetical protein